MQLLHATSLYVCARCHAVTVEKQLLCVSFYRIYNFTRNGPVMLHG